MKIIQSKFSKHCGIKLEIGNNNITRKISIFGRCAINQRTNHREIRKYSELKNNKNKVYQNMLDVAKAVLRDKCLALNIYFGKRGRPKSMI